MFGNEIKVTIFEVEKNKIVHETHKRLQKNAVAYSALCNNYGVPPVDLENLFKKQDGGLNTPLVWENSGLGEKLKQHDTVIKECVSVLENPVPDYDNGDKSKKGPRVSAFDGFVQPLHHAVTFSVGGPVRLLQEEKNKKMKEIAKDVRKTKNLHVKEMAIGNVYDPANYHDKLLELYAKKIQHGQKLLKNPGLIEIDGFDNGDKCPQGASVTAYDGYEEILSGMVETFEARPKRVFFGIKLN